MKGLRIRLIALFERLRLLWFRDKPEGVGVGKFFCFRDQPSGRCGECRWSKAGLENTDFWCTCPKTQLVDTICIQKNTLVTIESLERLDADAGDLFQ